MSDSDRWRLRRPEPPHGFQVPWSYLFMHDAPEDDDKSFEAACEAGDLACVRKFIERGLDLRRFERGENSPGILAADHGALAMVRLLVDLGADVIYSTDIGETKLSCAARSRSAELVLFLLERGANPRAVDRFGVSALDCAGCLKTIGS